MLSVERLKVELLAEMTLCIGRKSKVKKVLYSIFTSFNLFELRQRRAL